MLAGRGWSKASLKIDHYLIDDSNVIEVDFAARKAAKVNTFEAVAA